jgi:hypothetical protein
MEKMVSELKQILPFKDTTGIRDIVLVAAKEPKMLFYAHVDNIERDSSRKDEWWHLHLSVLSVPLQKIVWTLRTEQMTGREIFTMGGEQRFLQALNFTTERTVNQPEEKSHPVLKRVK